MPQTGASGKLALLKRKWRAPNKATAASVIVTHNGFLEVA
jgi:hypothetical protein